MLLALAATVRTTPYSAPLLGHVATRHWPNVQKIAEDLDYSRHGGVFLQLEGPQKLYELKDEGKMR